MRQIFIPVMTDIDNKKAWKECFAVKGVKLPVGYYFGVSAATGDLTDNHDIISMRTYDLATPDDVSTGLLATFISLFISITFHLPVHVGSC